MQTKSAGPFFYGTANGPPHAKKAYTTTVMYAFIDRFMQRAAQSRVCSSCSPGVPESPLFSDGTRRKPTAPP